MGACASDTSQHAAPRPSDAPVPSPAQVGSNVFPAPPVEVAFNERSYIRAGSQLPAVVMQTGLQEGKSTWNNLIPGLSQSHMVIAFDRPGRAATPLTEAPRDPCTIAAEERRLLQAANVPSPYILLGHSLGGLYQYVYAKLYPQDVAGVVLLDPTHPRHWETVQREAPGAATIIKGLRMISFGSADRREFDSQTACLERIDAQPIGRPVKLLFSGRFRPEERGAYERMLQPLRQDWLRLTGASGQQVIPDSGHYIQKDRPDVVIKAVQDLAVEIGR
jgi:pimeloyl-ACP methyl ester carboxylesterase